MSYFGCCPRVVNDRVAPGVYKVSVSVAETAPVVATAPVAAMAYELPNDARRSVTPPTTSQSKEPLTDTGLIAAINEAFKAADDSGSGSGSDSGISVMSADSKPDIQAFSFVLLKEYCRENQELFKRITSGLNREAKNRLVEMERVDVDNRLADAAREVFQGELKE